MNEAQLDAIYTTLCRTMTQIGEADAPLFLARFALLAVEKIGDAQTSQQLIEAAARDLMPSTAGLAAMSA